MSKSALFNVLKLSSCCNLSSMEQEISDYTGQMIEEYLINLTKRVSSLQEFCNEAKRYEHTKFVL